jgi:rubrerythrin
MAKPPKTEIGIRNLFRALDHIEVRMAEFYAWLSSVMGDPEAVWFFAKMSRQEESHRDLVRLEARLVENNATELDTVAVDVADLHDAMTDLDRFEAEHPRPTLKQALDFALQMESRAAEQHYRTAMAQIDTKTSSVVQSLARADEAHTEEIRRFRNRSVATGSRPKQQPAIIEAA